MIFIYFILVLILVYLIIYFSNLKIDINELNINSNNNNYCIVIKLALFNKLTWFKLKINKERIEKWKNLKWNKIIDKLTKVKDFKNIILKNWKEIIKDNLLHTIKILNINISRLNLKINIGTENAILTSFIVATSYSVISILLSNTIKKYKQENYNYIITPYYIKKNLFKMELNGIIYVKMVHIIHIIKFLIKKGSRFNERTSNRRFDDYSNEQYTRYDRCKHNYWRTN